MSYGIYDCDILNGTPMFNLELMKLSSYYKGKGEIVAYSDRFHPDRFNHFIVGKDRIDENFRFPIYDYNNIETIGRFFSPKKYYPMDLAIEKQKPDTYIYHKVINRGTLNQKELDFYKSQRRAEHLRLSLDGTTIWNDFESQLYGYGVQSAISIYDYDPGKIEHITDVLKDLAIKPDHKMQHTLLFKFPIRVSCTADLEPWSKFRFYQNRIIFIIERPPTAEDVGFLTENYELLKSKTIMCNVSKNTTCSDFLENINTLYRYIYVLRTMYKNFSLIYDQGFFPNEEWENLIAILNGFINNYLAAVKGRKHKKPTLTLYDYVQNSIYKKGEVTGLTPEEARNCFLFIAQHNYSLFKDFYEYEGEN